MKRNSQNSTIDDFFTASFSKKATKNSTSTGDQGSTIKNNNSNNLIIVKTASQKKVLKIEIPSLHKKEKGFDDQYYEKKFSDIGDSLINGIDTLFSGNFDQVNFTKLHNDVECYCRFKSSKNLFDEIIMPKMQEIISNFIEKLSAQYLDILKMAEIIQSFEESLSNFVKIILYLDRAYIFAHRINGFLSISDIIHNIIRKRFLDQINNDDNSDLTTRDIPTLNLILTQIKLQINIFRCNLDSADENDQNKMKSEISKKFTKVDGRFVKEPDENTSNYSIIHDNNEINNVDAGTQALSIVLKFIDDLGLYESNVEEELIKQTEEFYSKISQELKLSQFLDWLSIAQEKESELLEAGVKVSTINYILQSINKTALVDNQELLFGEEFQNAVNCRDDTIIQKLYSFFNNSDLRSIFTENLGKHFTYLAECIFNNDIKPQKQTENSPTKGRTIAASDKASRNFFLPEQSKDIIVNLIDLYSKVNKYVKKVFPEDTPVLSNVRSEFDHFFMRRSEVLAKLLARHFNKGLPIKKEEIEFFKMIHLKDIFEASYFFLITQRVLNWGHPSVDVSREKILIDYLKQISGTILVERLQTLVNDIEVSQKAEETINTIDIESHRPFKFRAVALNYQNMSNELFHDDVIYPPDIQDCLNAFKDSFIEEKKPNISKPPIHWSSKLSTVVGTFGNTKCQMTGDQALILLALQNKDKEKYTIDDLNEITGIVDDTISDNLAVMATKEAGFIVKAVDDAFIINPDASFDDDGTSKKKDKMIVFPSISSVIAQKEKVADESRIEEVKNNRIMCSIVAKMKAFKILSLSELFAKVKRDIGFEPSPEKFSSVVNSLVDKVILERINDKQLKYTTT